MPDPTVASFAKVDTHIFVGNAATARDKDILRDNKITAVLSLYDPVTGVARNDHAIAIPLAPGNHLRLPCNDTSTMDLIAILPKACDFIQEQDGKPALFPKADWDSESNTPYATTGRGCVLIHCHMGLSRAPAVAIAYLMRKRRQEFFSAIADMKKVRDIRPRGTFLEQLQLWETMKFEPWKENDKGEMVPKKEYAELLKRLKLKAEKKRTSGFRNPERDSSSDDSEPSPRSDHDTSEQQAV